MPARLDFELSKDELKAITRAVSKDPREEVRYRAAVIKLLHKGRSVATIAEKLNLASRTTIYNWFKRFKTGGVEALANRPKTGRPPKADARYCRELLALIPSKLEDMDFRATRWTARTLNAHMEKTTGVVLSDARFRALLHRLGCYGMFPVPFRWWQLRQKA